MSNDDGDACRAGLKDLIGKKKAKEDHVGPVKRGTIEEIGYPAEKHLSGRSCGLIINNNFKGKKGTELPGYNHDVVNITSTFGELNVDFKTEINLKGKTILPKIDSWLNMNDWDGVDCSICFILSHGDVDDVVYGEDLVKVKIDDIRSAFVNCEELNGKPKLIFIQACRGTVDSETITVDETKTAGVVERAKDADVFLFLPTARGKTSWVKKDGSLFIKTLCKVVQAYGGEYPLQDIVTKVNEILATEISTIIENDQDVTVVEVSETIHSLTYKLYFNNNKDGNNDNDNKEKLN